MGNGAHAHHGVHLFSVRPDGIGFFPSAGVGVFGDAHGGHPFRRMPVQNRMDSHDLCRQSLHAHFVYFLSHFLDHHPQRASGLLFPAGTAKAETLSLTVGDFIKATEDYHNSGSIADILDTLENKSIVPIFYLKRIKTGKFYYTFCTPEATGYIIKYLKSRPALKKSSKLFDYSTSAVTSKFREINDLNNWGFRGSYRFFRPHALRKFHASNISLSSESVDELQGRGKSEVHDAYIKSKPEELKKKYKSKMANVCILKTDETLKDDEFNIYINVFVGDKTINL